MRPLACTADDFLPSLWKYTHAVKGARVLSAAAEAPLIRSSRAAAEIDSALDQYYALVDSEARQAIKLDQEVPHEVQQVLDKASGRR